MDRFGASIVDIHEELVKGRVTRVKEAEVWTTCRAAVRHSQIFQSRLGLKDLKRPRWLCSVVSQSASVGFDSASSSMRGYLEGCQHVVQSLVSVHFLVASSYFQSWHQLTKHRVIFSPIFSSPPILRRVHMVTKPGGIKFVEDVDRRELTSIKNE